MSISRYSVSRGLWGLRASSPVSLPSRLVASRNTSVLISTDAHCASAGGQAGTGLVTGPEMDRASCGRLGEAVELNPGSRVPAGVQDAQSPGVPGKPAEETELPGPCQAEKGRGREGAHAGCSRRARRCVCQDPSVCEPACALEAPEITPLPPVADILLQEGHWPLLLGRGLEKFQIQDSVQFARKPPFL